MKAPAYFALFSGLTGLSLDDVVSEATAETPEEEERIRNLNLKRMREYITGEEERSDDSF